MEIHRGAAGNAAALAGGEAPSAPRELGLVALMAFVCGSISAALLFSTAAASSCGPPQLPSGKMLAPLFIAAHSATPTPAAM